MTDPKAAPAAEPAKNPAPNTQSLKPVTGLVSDKKDPDNDAAAVAAKKKEAEDAAIAKEVEAGTELSVEEQKKLEGVLGNASEAPDDDDGTVATPAQPDPNRTFDDSVPGAMKKIWKLVTSIPKDTPDEHVIWGAAGIKLNLGDLRELCKYLR